MTELARRFYVEGRVQGVFFRASTRTVALGLGLRGHAKNLPDGSVEVVAAGSETGLSRLEQWLWEGPRAARVTAVGAEPWLEPVPEGFRTG